MYKKLHLLAFVCSLLFFASFVLTHLVKTDLDWISHTLSRYALGEHGFIINSGFYCIGLTQVLLAMTLFNVRRDTLSTGALLLFCAGLGVFLVAIFPTQAPPADIISRLPHIVGASMHFLTFPLAVMALSTRMFSGKLKRYSKITGGITFVLFLILAILFLTSSFEDLSFFGLLEKLNILAINVWLITFSACIYQHTHEEIFISEKRHQA